MAEHSPDPPATADHLNGWKDIASYLGKGVRTVQRWEKEYGLPIRRLGRDGGEIILASRRELDAWLASQARLSPESAGAGEPQPGVPAAESPPSNDGLATNSQTGAPEPPASPQPPSLSPAPGRRWRQLTLAGALVAIATAAVVVWPRFTRGPLVEARVVAGGVAGYDSQGRELWRYARFGFDLDPRAFASDDSRMATLDLDGDGRREVLVAAPSADRSPSMALHRVSDDGSEVWRIRPERNVTFGDEVYSGPWVPHRIFTPLGQDGSVRLFAAFVHGTDYPTLLLELSPNGEILAEFWSAGHVQWVVPAIRLGREVLLVAAASNETRGVSLAIFESGRFTGSTPSEKPAYRCMSCGDARPTHTIVLPPRCVAHAYQGTSAPGRPWIDAAGRIEMQAIEPYTLDDVTTEFTVQYRLSTDLRLERAEFNGPYLIDHERLRRADVLNHEFGLEDEQAVLKVQLWAVSRWSGVPLAGSLDDVIRHPEGRGRRARGARGTPSATQ